MIRVLIVVGAILGGGLVLHPAAADSVDGGMMSRGFWGGTVSSGCRTVDINRATRVYTDVAAFLEFRGGTLDVATTRIPNCSRRQYTFYVTNLATTCYNGSSFNTVDASNGSYQADISHDCSLRWGGSGLMWYIEMFGGS